MAILGNTKVTNLTLLDGVVGNLNPVETGAYDLGTSSLKWRTLYGNAETATALKDKSNNTLTYLNYGASGMTTTSWLGSWDGYTLKAITPANAIKAGIGTTAIGSANQSIYWDGSKFVAGNSHANTTYTFADGTNGSFSVTPSGGSAQTVSIGKPATAGTADKLGTSTVGSSTRPIYLNSGTATAGEYMLPIYYNNLDFSNTSPNPGAYKVDAQTNPITNTAEYGSVLSLPGIAATTKHYAAQLLISSASGQTSAVHAYIRRLTSNPSWSDWSTLLDNKNTTAPNSVPTLSWGNETTVFTLNGSAVKIKMPTNPNTNLVKQSASTTASWRKVLLHYKDDAASTTAVTDSTNQVYATVGVSVQPSTNTLRAAAYNVLDKVTLQFNTATNALDFVFT